jgi:lysophospholipase L1-like esterase
MTSPLLKVVCCVALLVSISDVSAAETTPPLPPIAKACGSDTLMETPLPNSANALQQRSQIRILAIGTSSADGLGGAREGTPPLLEQILEHTIKGLDVEIINRGFSGELAEAAATRLKVEVALTHPDLVVWQVGTNDALAQVAVEKFEATVTSMVRWLKEHDVDVLLVGLHYSKRLAKDPHYQAIRSSLRRIATAENVPRVGRYEAAEIIARTQQPDQAPLSAEAPESSYNCMAQYVARAIAVGLFARPKPPPVPF